MLFLTEEELSDWISSPSYVLPRSGVPVEKMDSPNQVGAERVSDSRDDWLLAVYDAESSSPRKGVPFSKVSALLGMSERKLALLENHYAGFGPKIEAATPNQRGCFEAWWRKSRIETLAVDSEAGADAMAELMGRQRRVNKAYGRRVAEVLMEAELGLPSTSLPSYLFAYSRSVETGLPSLGAAFCDLGHILRMCLKEEKGDVISGLARRIMGLFGEGRVFSQDDIGELMRSLKCLKEFKLRYVLFLKWKYAAERNGGAVDFREMLDDTAWFTKNENLAAEFDEGVLLYGAFAGFRSFAIQYHQRLRELN